MEVVDVSLAFSGPCDLGVEGEGRLDTDEEAFDVEGLEHDLGHLLSVFRGVHGGFSQNELVLARFAADVLINRLVPEFLDAFPVVDLTVLEQRSHVVGGLLGHCVVSNVEVQVRVVELHLLVERSSGLLRDNRGGLDGGGTSLH